MNPALQNLLELNILHVLVGVIEGLLVLMLIVYMIVSWIPQWRDGKFGHVMTDLVSPITEPIDRVIPPINLGGLRMPIGFFVGWWAVLIVSALISQALPQGW